MIIQLAPIPGPPFVTTTRAISLRSRACFQPVRRGVGCARAASGLGAGPAGCAVRGDAVGHSGRQGRLDHRNRRRHVFGLRPGRYRRAFEGVFRRHGFRRQPGPRRQRRAGRECLCRHHHHAEEVRNHPDGAGQWQGEGFFDRAGAAGRSRPRRRHRRAPEGRARSDDRLDAARGGQWRGDDARIPAAPAPAFSTAGCATTSSSISSAWKR